MSPALLDEHAHGDGPLQRAPAPAKLATLVAFLAAVALLPPGAAVLVPAAIVLAVATAVSRVPLTFLLRRLLLLEPFVIGIALMTLFQPDGPARFAVVLTRSTLCLWASLLVAATTPISGLLAALRALRLPGILVMTIALTYRYLFVLVDEALRMRRARAARTLRPGRLPEWRALSSVVAHLFLRVSERAERLHAAMCARGVGAVSALEVGGLGFRYADGTAALHDVSFRVEEGERVALVGPNGAGKSTLLLHLNGLLPDRPARESAVRVFGTPVTREHLAEVRARVGFLFQDPDDQLFCATVFEDVAFGPRQRGVDEARVTELVHGALETMGLSGFGERPPHRLSRGEKQRVCLAGLLACEPSALVLDEPTTHLDPRGRRELGALLAALPVAQIVATHDLELVVRLCARAILLDEGRVIAEGPTARILGDEELMRAHGLERPHVLSHHHPHDPE